MSDPWRLDGRVALVTGAGRGLGRGCALELARAGATVLLVARTESELDAEAAEIEAGGRRGARSSPTSPTRTRSSRGRRRRRRARATCACCVAAAGTNRPGPARDYPIADWDLLFDDQRPRYVPRLPRFGDLLLTPQSRRRDRHPLLADGQRSAIRDASPTAPPSTRSTG